MPLDVWEKETVLSEVGRNQPQQKALDEVNAPRAVFKNDSFRRHYAESSTAKCKVVEGRGLQRPCLTVFHRFRLYRRKRRP